MIIIQKINTKYLRKEKNMSKQNGQSLTGNEILKRILPIIISKS